MSKKLFICITVVVLFVPFLSFSKIMKYTNVGYVDLEMIIHIYTPKFLESGIRIMEDTVSGLETNYFRNYEKYKTGENFDSWKKIQEKRSELERYRKCLHIWEISGELEDDSIFEMVQRDIMAAIQKTSVMEGFSLILNNTGNFVYGNEEVNISSKVLFRLDEKLMNLQNREQVDILTF